jgi:hypothetical protein
MVAATVAVAISATFVIRMARWRYEIVVMLVSFRHGHLRGVGCCVARVVGCARLCRPFMQRVSQPPRRILGDFLRSNVCAVARNEKDQFRRLFVVGLTGFEPATT